MGDSERSFTAILTRLQGLGYLPSLHGTGVMERSIDPGSRSVSSSGLSTERVALRVVRVPEQKLTDTNPLIHVALFLATLASTLVAGAIQRGANPFLHPKSLALGIPFSFTLLAILGAHELGHYFVSRKNGVKATLPFFLPNPSPYVGTFGAVIRVKSLMPSRRTLLEIGAAGPICGMVFALPAVLVGLKFSQVIPSASLAGATRLGDSLLFSVAQRLVIGRLNPGSDVVLHPVAYAGWIGFLVTAMNLLPVGQLDGGHIAYALLGRGHRWVAIIAVLALVGLGFLWQGWFIWVVLILLLGLRHPPPLNDFTPLDPTRMRIALLAAIIFILTFTPIPITL